MTQPFVCFYSRRLYVLASRVERRVQAMRFYVVAAQIKKVVDERTDEPGKETRFAQDALSHLWVLEAPRSTVRLSMSLER